ncbi:hypothetical protein QAD02_011342 [Eretmocerus hayati]|uniref:Uncharacterized protein n=1 Tax=Eretmocerus hayati TaxID=131215 RepID=A0ACC2NXN6_9HYME|nr:hypothetical protein QAD02_011342 [Eretmocerus hayati]
MSTSYKDASTLPINFEKKDLEWSAKGAIIALAGLAKYTKILGKNYDFTELRKLMKDDMAMAVGALLLKFNITILFSGCPRVGLIDPNDEQDNLNRRIRVSPYGKKSEKQWSYCFPIMILHGINGCIPNVDRYLTYGNKFILCPLQPIKSGDQLILFSKSKSIWGLSKKSDRQSDHISVYGRLCNCQACVEWSKTLDNDKKVANHAVSELHCPTTRKLWQKRNSIISDWKTNILKPNFPDLKMLIRVIDLVSETSKELAMPSVLIMKSVGILAIVSRLFYSPSEMYVKVPHIRWQSIGSIYDHSPKICSKCKVDE